MPDTADPEDQMSDELVQFAADLLDGVTRHAVYEGVPFPDLIWALMNCVVNICLQDGPRGRELKILDGALDLMGRMVKQAPAALAQFEKERELADKMAKSEGMTPGHA